MPSRIAMRQDVAREFPGKVPCLLWPEDFAMAAKVRLVSSRDTPGVNVRGGAPGDYRTIKVSADEMRRLTPNIREQLYNAARNMRRSPALKRVK
jgi:hypothetical protein